MNNLDPKSLKPAMQFKWWYCVIYGVVQISEGLIVLITIGYIAPKWTLKLSLFAVKKNIYRNQK